MNLYTAKIPINSAFLSMGTDEAMVLSGVCELSSQLRTFTALFNIAHVPSRMGWIVDPIPKLQQTFPKLTTKKIQTILRKLAKDELIDYLREPVAARPNVAEIERRYSTGYATVKVSDTVETADIEWDNLSSQEYWDKIPGANHGLPKVTLSEYVEKTKTQFDWAAQYKQLNNAPEHMIEVSYLCHQITGFIPDTNDWLASVNVLLSLSGNNIETLKEGLIKGNVMRSSGQVAMTSLRSYQGAVREVAASKRVVVNGTPQIRQVVRV